MGLVELAKQLGDDFIPWLRINASHIKVIEYRAYIRIVDRTGAKQLVEGTFVTDATYDLGMQLESFILNNNRDIFVGLKDVYPDWRNIYVEDSIYIRDYGSKPKYRKLN